MTVFKRLSLKTAFLSLLLLQVSVLPAHAQKPSPLFIELQLEDSECARMLTAPSLQLLPVVDGEPLTLRRYIIGEISWDLIQTQLDLQSMEELSPEIQGKRRPPEFLELKDRFQTLTRLKEFLQGKPVVFSKLAEHPSYKRSGARDFLYALKEVIADLNGDHNRSLQMQFALQSEREWLESSSKKPASGVPERLRGLLHGDALQQLQNLIYQASADGYLVKIQPFEMDRTPRFYMGTDDALAMIEARLARIPNARDLPGLFTEQIPLEAVDVRQERLDLKQAGENAAYLALILERYAKDFEDAFLSAVETVQPHDTQPSVN